MLNTPTILKEKEEETYNFDYNKYTNGILKQKDEICEYIIDNTQDYDILYDIEYDDGKWVINIWSLESLSFDDLSILAHDLMINCNLNYYISIYPN